MIYVDFINYAYFTKFKQNNTRGASDAITLKSDDFKKKYTGAVPHFSLKQVLYLPVKR